MPTTEGTAVLLVGGALFLMATNLMSGLLFALDALLVSLLLVGAASAVVPLWRMSATRSAPPRAVEGAPVLLGVTLTARLAGGLVTVEDGWAGARARTLLSLILSPGPAVAAITIVPPRRGHYDLGPVEVTCRGAVGLFRARARIALRHRIAVWPRVRPVPRRVFDRLAPAGQGHLSPVRSREPHDLYGVRDFRPGDTLARVHWRTSARRGALVVQEYEQARTPALAVVVDLDRRQPPSRLDAAVRAAASLFQAARERGMDVALCGWDGGPVEHREFEPGMDWLAGAVPGSPPLSQVLPSLAIPDRALLVISAWAQTPVLPTGSIAVLPTDELVDDHTAWTGLVYTADGAVEAW